MIPQPVSIITGLSIGDDIQWGGGQDSFYEVTIPFPIPALPLSYSHLIPSRFFFPFPIPPHLVISFLFSADCILLRAHVVIIILCMRI